MANLVIDLNQAGFDFEPEEMEVYSLRLADELRGDLAEDAGLARESDLSVGGCMIPMAGWVDLPEGVMPGAAKFLEGILKAEVNPTNMLSVMKWLWNLRPNTVLKVNYESDGKKVALEYRTQEQLDSQIEALRKIDSLMIQLIQRK